MRINRYIAACGLCSRRKADQFIEDGKVTIDGKVVEKNYDVKDGDKVLVFGKSISKEKNYYFMLNKPPGYLSAVSDSRKKVVTDLIKSEARLFPVGRLDYNSEGLILMTNDGDLTNKLLHPSRKVIKEYYVVVKGELRREVIKAFNEGILLKGEERKTLPAKIRTVSFENGRSHLSIKISEGKKRQIRRMLEKFRYEIFLLRRVAMGSLRMKGLKVGDYRELTGSEIRGLLNETNT